MATSRIAWPRGEGCAVTTIGAEIMISPQFEDSRQELLAQLEVIDY